MKRYIAAVCLALAAAAAAGCGGNSPAGEETAGRLQIENLSIDNYFLKGTAVQTFAEIPKRVIVVGENETETLLALGAEDSIALAVAQNSRAYAMRPENWEKFQRLNKVKSMYLNMEYIGSQKPDLIVAQQCIFIKNRLKNTQYWNDRGIRTMVPINTNSPSRHVYSETVDREMQFIGELGQIFHKENEARRITDGVYRKIDEVNEKTKDLPKPKVMIVEFLSTMVSYDRSRLVGDMVSRIGGKVAETPAVITYEHIVKENPDVLFVVCSHQDYGVCIDHILENPALQELPCVKNKRVYSVPLRFTYSALCRTEDGLQFLAERMYPDVITAE